MKSEQADTFGFYENSYVTDGFGAQRRYPNEELCRFMGRNFFGLPKENRSGIRILDTGCGSGANLWMIAREGFDAVGVDLSPAAIKLCEQMLASYDCQAELHVADMTKLPLDTGSVDAVVDVFSSNCLDQKQGDDYLSEVSRILKKGGKFFSYFPSTRSDTWTDQNFSDKGSKNRIDDDTLNGLHRKTGPYYGNDYPFRFLHERRYQHQLEDKGFSVNYCETLTRTYRNRQEVFEFVVVEGSKI